MFKKFLLLLQKKIVSRQVSYTFFFLAFLFPLMISSESSIPELRARVNDLEGILDSIQVETLEDKLKDLEKRKGSQVAILIIPTTQGESIEGYSLRVVENWKLGRKNINDGVLLLIAIQDRKMRIEVGYGLEGVLPDAICKRIISEQIRPHFKEKNYYEGIDNAVNSITKLIDGEELPPPVKSSDSDAINGGIFFNLFLLLFGTGITKIFSSSKIGRWICGAIFGFIITIVIFGMLIAANFSFGLILLVCIFSFFVVTFLIYRWSSESSSGGSSWSGGSSSYDSGWSSSSSDSFSSGGGDFGGGGASGDW